MFALLAQNKKKNSDQVPSAMESVCPPPSPLMTFGVPGAVHYQMYGWSQAESCNIVNIQMIAQASMTTVVQEEVDSSQSNTMYIKTPGNVTIVDSTISLSNNYSVKSVQAAFISNAAQQQLMLSILQHSSAVVKGFTILPQDSSAGNVINGYMKATITMCTTIQHNCSQSQSNALVVDVGGDITIQDSYLSEDNSATQVCVQGTVDKNVSMQSLTAQIAQVASAESLGIPLWVFVLVVVAFIVGFFADGFAMFYADNGAAYFAILMGAILTLVGMAYLRDSFTPSQMLTTWYGCSPGIQNTVSACSGMYRTGVVLDYASPDAAMEVLTNKKNKNLAAFDWHWNDNSIGGTAQWYEYASVADEPNSVFVQNCGEIISPDLDDSKKVISLRPDAYLNVGLNNQAPSIAIIADLIVDCDTGNIWVRMPPGFNTCNPSSYGGQNADEQWVFVAPKTVNLTNVNNVFNAISQCTTCSSRCCKSGCVETAAITPAPGAKVYIYIDPLRTLNYNINADYQFGEGTYSMFMSKATSGLPGTYLWDMSSPVGNALYEQKVTENDYFLVVFPWGPKASSSFFGVETFGEWPANATDFEPYDFGQAFALYKAVKDPATKKFVPYVGTVPPKPDNWLPGLGPNVDVQAFQSTCVKTKVRPPKVQEYYSISITALGIFLLLAGLALVIFIKKNPPVSTPAAPVEQTSSNLNGVALETGSELDTGAELDTGGVEGVTPPSLHQTPASDTGSSAADTAASVAAGFVSELIKTFTMRN